MTKFVLESLGANCRPMIPQDQLLSDLLRPQRRAKICFIDEADYLSKNAQAALRKVIEKFSENCRFIFAVNDISKILPDLRSRLMEIGFDIAPADRLEVQRPKDMRRSFPSMALDSIRSVCERSSRVITDFRSIANHLEFEFAYQDQPD
jgi:DNA polymerase III delta prime subunit